MTLEVFLTDFKKTAQVSNLMKIRIVAAEFLREDGETCVHTGIMKLSIILQIHLKTKKDV
jgi:hypothetical protein